MFTRPPVVNGRLLAPIIFLSFFFLFFSLSGFTLLDLEGWALWARGVEMFTRPPVVKGRFFGPPISAFKIILSFWVPFY